MNEGFTIKDGDEFGTAVPSLKEVALIHIRKISGICCEEFTKGYWEEKPVKVGAGIAITRTYHQDNRAVFCNAVDFLLWLVFPMSDKEFKDKYVNFKETKTELDDKLAERKEIFKEINIMFNRTKYFDSLNGQTE